MSEHQKSAERIIKEVAKSAKEAADQGNVFTSAQIQAWQGNIARELSQAQVHATLYLAEQQRIANLIALLPSLDDTPVYDRMDGDRPLPTSRDKALDRIHEGIEL